jgi:hypothetical protein
MRPSPHYRMNWPVTAQRLAYDERMPRRGSGESSDAYETQITNERVRDKALEQLADVEHLDGLREELDEDAADDRGDGDGESAARSKSVQRPGRDSESANDLPQISRHEYGRLPLRRDDPLASDVVTVTLLECRQDIVRAHDGLDVLDANNQETEEHAPDHDLGVGRDRVEEALVTERDSSLTARTRPIWSSASSPKPLDSTVRSSGRSLEAMGADVGLETQRR